MELKDRLVLFARTQYNLGQNYFEDYVGWSRGQINKIRGGISSSSIEKIVAKCPELNVDWLVTGRGEMVLNNDASPDGGVVNVGVANDGFKDRLEFFARSNGFSTVPQLAAACGLNAYTFTQKGTAVPAKALLAIAEKYPTLDIDWLVTGRRRSAQESVAPVKMLPLLPFDAIAGSLSDNINTDFPDTIPAPPTMNGSADFAIRVDGDSMYPRYSSGEILLVRKVDDPSFFQWGKVYVLATKQGCVVKRLFPCKDDDNSITCHSENTVNYPDYDIPREDILGVGLVVGHMGLD